ncbi:MAG TPA: hypothetical protein VK662_08535 [Acidothermaceae bacterium]|jgi:hypothetical protein|nr:hypothetical protein [Acidothermaceae bacterium]
MGHAAAIRTSLADNAERQRTVPALLSYDEAVALICEATGWPVGHVWARTAQTWRSAGGWHDAGPEFADLKASTAAADLGSGRGIVAAVLHLGASRVLSGLSGLGSTVRERDAAAIGLATVVGVPIRRDGRIDAVFEFVTADRVEAEDSLADALLEVAALARPRVPGRISPADAAAAAAAAARKTVLLDIALPIDLAG